jgi:hypothetical protein
LRRLRADEPSGAPGSQVTPASFLQLQESDDSGSGDLRRPNEEYLFGLVILSRAFPQAEKVSDAIVADFHTRVTSSPNQDIRF